MTTAAVALELDEVTSAQVEPNQAAGFQPLGEAGSCTDETRVAHTAVAGIAMAEGADELACHRIDLRE